MKVYWNPETGSVQDTPYNPEEEVNDGMVGSSEDDSPRTEDED